MLVALLKALSGPLCAQLFIHLVVLWVPLLLAGNVQYYLHVQYLRRYTVYMHVNMLFGRLQSIPGASCDEVRRGSSSNFVSAVLAMSQNIMQQIGCRPYAEYALRAALRIVI